MDGSEVVVVGEHRWSSSSESSVRDTVNIAQVMDLMRNIYVMYFQYL